MNLRKLSSTALCLLLSLFSCLSATYYVDFDAGDDANDGLSTSTPWRTIPGTRNLANTGYRQSAWGSITTGNKVPQGSTIWLKRGTTLSTADSASAIAITTDYYVENSASRSAYIISPKSDWGSGVATLDGNGMTHGINGVEGFIMVQMDGVEISGQQDNKLWVVRAPKDAIHGKEKGGSSAAITNFTSQWLVISNAGTSFNTDNAAAGGGSINLRKAQSPWILNNHIDGTGGTNYVNGVKLGDSGSLQCFNYIVSNNFMTGLRGDPTDNDAGIGVKPLNSDGVIVNNTVINSLKGVDIGEQSAASTYTAVNYVHGNTFGSNYWGLNANWSANNTGQTNKMVVRAWNNLIYSNLWNGCNFYAAGLDIVAVNNTFAWNGDSSQSGAYSGHIRCSFNSPSDTNNAGIILRLRNNIFYRGYDHVLTATYYNPTNQNFVLDSDNNLYIQSSTDGGNFSNWGYFESGSDLNYAITWGSPWSIGSASGDWFTKYTKFSTAPQAGGTGHFNNDSKSRVILNGNYENNDATFWISKTTWENRYKVSGTNLTGFSWYDSRMAKDKNGTSRSYWTMGALEGPPMSSSEVVDPVPSGTVYYASPSGSSGNSGTINSPWSIEKAFQNTTYLSGDSIALLSGTYSGTNDPGRGNSKVLYWNPSTTLAASQTNTYANTTNQTWSTGAAAAATPHYPLRVVVPALSFTPTNVTISLTNLTHTFSEDIQILLVTPNGSKIALWFAAGQGTSHSSQNFVFSDHAASGLVDAGSFSGGTYKPSDYSAANITGGGPVRPYTTNLSATLTGQVDGNWDFYMADKASGDGGTLAAVAVKISGTVASSGALTIPVYGYRGARAVIDAQHVVFGSGATIFSPIFKEVEFTTADTVNMPAAVSSGSPQTELFSGGNSLHKSYSELRNCILYNVGQVNGNVFNKMEGNLISFAGRSGFQHVHYGGDYTVARSLNNNVIGYNSGDVFKLVGAVNNTVNNNVVLLPGSMAAPSDANYDGEQWALVEEPDTGQTAFTGNAYVNNLFLQDPFDKFNQLAIHLGRGLTGNSGMNFRSNVVTGIRTAIKFGSTGSSGDYANSQVLWNTFLKPGDIYPIVEFNVAMLGGNAYNSNAYYFISGSTESYVHRGTNYSTLATWRTASGTDANSTSTLGLPPQTVKVYPNPYTSYRGSFGWVNFSSNTTVSVDVGSAGILSGRRYVLINCGSPSQARWLTNNYSGVAQSISSTSASWPLDTPGNHANNSVLTNMSPRYAGFYVISSPEPPYAVAAVTNASGVAVSWTDPYNTAKISTYGIYRGASPATMSKIGSASFGSTTYTDTTASPNTSYYYGVSSANGYVDSDPQASGTYAAVTTGAGSGSSVSAPSFLNRIYNWFFR